MLHRIRLAMQTGTFAKLDGEIEVDETFIGGKARNMHKASAPGRSPGRAARSRPSSPGRIQRGGEVRAVSSRHAAAHPRSRRPRARRARLRVYTDAHPSYFGLPASTTTAWSTTRKYVDGQVHTNGVENFWSLLKRGLTAPTSGSSRSTCSATSTSRCSPTTSAT